MMMFPIEIGHEMGKSPIFSHTHLALTLLVTSLSHPIIPVVPHKAVAEVSQKETERELGCCESRMAERIH